VVGVNKDDLVVLVDAILVDPVQVQDAQLITLLPHFEVQALQAPVVFGSEIGPTLN
jgi:hypothetical protein